MTSSGNSTSTNPSPRNLEERLELANLLYREYHTQCFWHCPPKLEITEEWIPFVVKGLRTNGGRRGFVLASKLLPEGIAIPEQEPPECR